MTLFYIILLIADLFLWIMLARELRGRNRIVKFTVLAVKASLSATLVYLSVALALSGSMPYGPADAYRQIVMGSMALLLLVTSSFSLLTLLVAGLASLIMKRKMRWRGPVLVSVFLLMTLLVADAHFRQRLNIKTVRTEIPIPGLDPALEGLKIALVSDIHVSSWHSNYSKLERAMLSVTAEEPDLLMNTGDFITYSWQEFGECDTILRKARALYGAFAVEGNHDDGSYYPDYDGNYGEVNSQMLKKKIEASGYTLLRDTAVIINHNGTSLAVAGVVTQGHRLDMNYGDFEKALGTIPDSLFTILLLHDPAGWLLTSVTGRMPDLTVSGHTHGLQVGLPGGGWSPAAEFHEHWKGKHRLGDSFLYVTTGLGSMGMSARFFMPPEIVYLTLTSYRTK
jgi:predicted MPP superfamily phosphohydrolase